MKTIIVHLSPYNLPFSTEFKRCDVIYDEIPDFSKVCIESCKKHLNDEPIVITNDFINNELTEETVNFFTLCKKGFPSLYRDPFWFLTLLRIFIVFEYVKKHNINEFIHLEYDNIVYSGESVFEQLPDGCYFSRVGPEAGSAGVMYCNSILKFENVISGIKNLIRKGEDVIKKYTSYDFMSEMIMIDLLVRGEKAEYLPLVPGDKFFDLTKCVFDGASYGQYIGGTNNGHAPGWYGMNHYVGMMLHSKQIQIKFENKHPAVLYKDCLSDIFNLHIHSKKLNLYV